MTIPPYTQPQGCQVKPYSLAAVYDQAHQDLSRLNKLTELSQLITAKIEMTPGINTIEKDYKTGQKDPQNIIDNFLNVSRSLNMAMDILQDNINKINEFLG